LCAPGRGLLFSPLPGFPERNLMRVPFALLAAALLALPAAAAADKQAPKPPQAPTTKHEHGPTTPPAKPGSGAKVIEVQAVEVRERRGLFRGRGGRGSRGGNCST